jgi:hypothetical protein
MESKTGPDLFLSFPRTAGTKGIRCGSLCLMTRISTCSLAIEGQGKKMQSSVCDLISRPVQLLMRR